MFFVTAADIAAEFGATTGPFLLIGQIEEQLRWLMERRLDLRAALIAVGLPADGSSPGASDLTMGELHRVLDNDDNWAKIGIKFDRTSFCAELSAVRELRNDIMHFRDPPSDEDRARIGRCANLVRMAYLAGK